MGLVHLSSEELSALLDGELSPQRELEARDHLIRCASCSAEFGALTRLDQDLRQPPVLTCDEVQDLLSASFDGQASEPEQAVAHQHLAACESCRDAVTAYPLVTAALRALPRGMPSAHVDAAIARLVEPRPVFGRARVSGVAARTLITITAVIAVVIAGIQPGALSPVGSVPPSGGVVLVASAQQIVLNPRNNTLYVLDTYHAAVDARDAGTNALKTSIAVGGAPTALALNEAANTILVLDSAQKRVTEIDASSNTIIGATTVSVPGTPTSISVDPNAGKIIVSSAASSGTPASQPGSVAVINGSTKEVEQVRQTDVAPQLIVPDQRGGRTALVSADTTTIVDSSYKVIATLPGGVSAAFSVRNDNIAVLSAVGADSLITFNGLAAPQPLKLSGKPRAMTALPDGGFLVLVESGSAGHVSKINRDGALVGSVEVAVTGGDLAYDPTTDRFLVANAGRLDSGEVPTQVAVSAPPTAQATTAAPSPSASATASPPPSAVTGTAPAGPTPVPTLAPSVAESARFVSPGLFSVSLPAGISPQMATARGSRLWTLDQSNGVGFLDMNTGEFFTLGKLRAGAHVAFWVAGPTYVFGVDLNGDVHVINAAREEIIDTYATNVLSTVSAVTVATDDRLWIALRNAPYLLAFDPRTKRMDSFNLGPARVSALATAPDGRIFYSDDVRGAVGTFDPRTSHLNEVSFARQGTATTALMVDSTSTLWVGTNAGEIYSVRGGSAKLMVSLQRPVSAFAADQNGRAWYLAQLPSGLAGFSYAPADGSRAPSSVPGPAVSLAFNPLGRAFLADPRGAVFMSIESGR